MADLVKEFFRRDLTDGEARQLEQLLESSDDACLRLAQFAEKAYLRTGLPRPKAPGSPPGGGLGPGLFHGFHPLLMVAALTGAAALVYFYHSQPTLVPAVHQKIAALAPRTAPRHTSPPPARVLAKPSPIGVPQSITAHPVLSPGPGLVEPVAYVPGKKYGGLSVTVQQAADDLVTVRVLDSTRAEVRALYAGLLAQGTWTFTWDGKLSNGQRAGIGSYWVEVKSGGRSLTREIRIQGKTVAGAK